MAGAVERMRQSLRRHTEEQARGAELEGRLQESERIAVELRGEVTSSLFAVGVELLSTASRSPETAQQLRSAVTELDAIGRELREVALAWALRPGRTRPVTTP